MPSNLKIVAVVIATAFAVAACASEGDPARQSAEDVSDLPSGPSALEAVEHPAFPDPLVDTSEIISGGPPPDGIPPIDEPRFVTVGEADDWLDPQEPVVWLRVGDDVRAYPVQILMWHEIVNDTVSGVPVSVTYCPLCNTAVSFERTIDGVETTFGTSGSLYHSALVMYDRATESLWTHFDGRAVVGVLAGMELETVPSPLVAWSEFAAAHPDGQVLDRDRTGHDRDYGRNPYTGYDDPEGRPFLFRGDTDDRARAQQRVVAVELGEEARAWTLDAIGQGEATATNTSVGDREIVILWRAGQSTALESTSVSQGRDVGSVAVFVPDVGERSLTFTVEDSAFTDEETGSTWDLTGTATDGPLEGERLEQVHHFDTFWFAWAAYEPDTDLIEEVAR